MVTLSLTRRALGLLPALLSLGRGEASGSPAAVVNSHEPFVGLTVTGVKGGRLYIGVAGSDPETDPQACFWDEAGTIAATQPIDIVDGHPMRLGAPTQLFTGSTYSMRVRDPYGSQIFYLADSAHSGSGSSLLLGSIADAEAANIPLGAQTTGVMLAGYHAAGDGGQGLYAYVDVQGAGPGKFQSADGAWWELADLEPNVRQFGAKGDGVTFAQGAFDAAIAYAEARREKVRVVRIPAGDYVLNGVTPAYVTIEGEGGARTDGSPISPAEYGTRLIHATGAATDMIRMLPGVGWEAVRNLAILGRQNQNRRRPVAITGVTSRTVFKVAPADVPATPSNVASWPFYGLCIFFAGDYRIGTGIVSAVNARTGQVTLLPGWDNYATRRGAGNLLTRADTVVFAPRGTFDVGGSTLVNVSDSTAAGYVGIRLEGPAKVVENVFVENMHCGVVSQHVGPRLDDIWTRNCAMAGVAKREMTTGADWSVGRAFLQAFYAADPDQPSNPMALDNTAYLTPLCALWGVPSASNIAELVADQFIIPVIDRGGFLCRFGYLLLDKPLKLGWWSGEGASLGGTADSSHYIDTLVVHTIPASVVTPAPITYPGGKRVVFSLTGTLGRQIVIDKATTSRFDTTSLPADDFEQFVNITAVGAPTPNDMVVSQFLTQRGMTNLFYRTAVNHTVAGDVGIGTAAPTCKLDVNDTKLRVRSSQTPASATAAGKQGDICWDASFVYVCVGANTWKRAALSTW